MNGFLWLYMLSADPPPISPTTPFLLLPLGVYAWPQSDSLFPFLPPYIAACNLLLLMPMCGVCLYCFLLASTISLFSVAAFSCCQKRCLLAPIFQCFDVLAISFFFTSLLLFMAAVPFRSDRLEARLSLSVLLGFRLTFFSPLCLLIRFVILFQKVRSSLLLEQETHFPRPHGLDVLL